jgi:uncharacterized protein YlxP (DUF503 family)
VAVVANDGRFVNQVLSKVLDFISADSRAEIIDQSMEIR